MHAPQPLPFGVYEKLVSHRTEQELSSLEGTGAVADITNIARGEENHVLANHLGQLIHHKLQQAKTNDEREELTRKLLAVLGAEYQDQQPLLVPDAKHPHFQQLTELRARQVANPLTRPQTALSEAALLTHSGGHEPTLGNEIAAELASADRVDLLIAFAKWSGLRILEKQLAALAERNVPFRIITSTYLGASDAKAITKLATDFGGQVRINYSGSSTRLHAKAWYFHRDSGYSTAYVGSSNLSESALVDGLEWNVKLSQTATPELLRKFEATFETYWEQPEFELFDPETDQEKLRNSLQKNIFRDKSARDKVTDDLKVDVSGLDVRPYPHQVIMLEHLEAERVEHNRHHNLLVAATGTGKTVIAALDYRNLAHTMSPGSPRYPRLLFVAHRQEILKQSLRTFREVLADGSFGELLFQGHEPHHWEHVFASVQSLNPERLEQLEPAHFDVIIIDEFHHAQAPTYRRILEHFQPKELLGLTATPERADGVNVAKFFGNHITSELRLWDALEIDVLVPFHYFGVADTIAVDQAWKNGKYDETLLSNLYTGNNARVRLIIKALHNKLPDLDSMKALGFCASVEHAQFMAEAFNDARIPAAALTGTTPKDHREQILNDLRAGALKIVFAVDVLNEGVDIPEINTVLFLRPTESATIFLQQLGRGLRRAPGKDVLTVLDFIGVQHQKFRFDLKLRAITGRGRADTEDDVKNGFPYLPPGTQIVLDETSQERVLQNLRSQLKLNVTSLARDIQDHAGHRSITEYQLTDYLTEAQHGLSDIYRGGSNGRSWTSIKNRVLPADFAFPPEDVEITLGAWRLLHVDDHRRAEKYWQLLTEPFSYHELSDSDQRWARMLYFTVLHRRHGTQNFTDYDEAFTWVRGKTVFLDEIRQIFAAVLDRARITPRATALGEEFPVHAHARYRREEILASLDVSSWDKPRTGHVEGVEYAPEFSTDALLINLLKSEKTFSPTTMYRDYAISPTLFHWESQNRTGPDSKDGQRYIEKDHNGTHTLLFVRESQNDDVGTAPYICLGSADLAHWRGEKPMQITWQLHEKMPEEWFQLARSVA